MSASDQQDPRAVPELGSAEGEESDGLGTVRAMRK